MADHNITLEQAQDYIENFDTLNISTQFSTFISRDQIEELLSQEGAIGLNIYNGYANDKIHLVFVAAQNSDIASYEIKDDLSLIKNGYTGGPGLSIEPNDLNTWK